VVNVTLHQTPRIIERQRCARPDALPLERFVPALDLSVRLRVKRRGSDVVIPEILMNSLKSLAMNCGRSSRARHFSIQSLLKPSSFSSVEPVLRKSWTVKDSSGSPSFFACSTTRYVTRLKGCSR
jgi:hypothetical protein